MSSRLHLPVVGARSRSITESQIKAEQPGEEELVFHGIICSGEEGKKINAGKKRSAGISPTLTRIYGIATSSPKVSAGGGGGSLVSQRSPSSSTGLVANEWRANHVPRMTMPRREKKKKKTQANKIAPEFSS